MPSHPFCVRLAVQDAGATLDFFESLGYEVVRDSLSRHETVHAVREGGATLFTVQPRAGACAFLPRPASSLSPASAIFYLRVDDIFAKLDQAGDKIDIIAKYEDDHCRICYFPDPDGHVFAFIEREEEEAA
ncbi:VOC family protein [Chromobacterium vaccinii]|uniref:VOC family protein n=1 Tax=Chromobacterium vaccinii TaxID=1108595 RepID=A0ABV0FD55_9NEIS